MYTKEHKHRVYILHKPQLETRKKFVQFLIKKITLTAIQRYLLRVILLKNRDYREGISEEVRSRLVIRVYLNISYT